MDSARDHAATAAPRRVRSRSRGEHQLVLSSLKAVNDERCEMRKENIDDVTEAR